MPLTGAGPPADGKTPAAIQSQHSAEEQKYQSENVRRLKNADLEPFFFFMGSYLEQLRPPKPLAAELKSY